MTINTKLFDDICAELGIETKETAVGHGKIRILENGVYKAMSST